MDDNPQGWKTSKCVKHFQIFCDDLVFESLETPLSTQTPTSQRDFVAKVGLARAQSERGWRAMD